MRERVTGHDLEILIEPGRSIVAGAGVLLTRVLYRKTNGDREFVIVDAAMNDLIRPALYHSHHEIVPLRETQSGTITADVVGPVCESGDFLARGREMAERRCRAICWPFARPARTRSWRRRTTTRGRVRRRFWWKAMAIA